MNTSLLKHNCRLEQMDSLPLNAANGARGSDLRKSPSVVQGQTPVKGLGEEAEAFCTFAHNILTPHGQKMGVSGHRGHQWIDASGVYGQSARAPFRWSGSEAPEKPKAFRSTSNLSFFTRRLASYTTAALLQYQY